MLELVKICIAEQEKVHVVIEKLNRMIEKIEDRKLEPHDRFYKALEEKKEIIWR